MPEALLPFLYHLYPSPLLDINDLEMAGKLLAWLVLEGIVGTKNLRYKNVGLFSDNTAAVLWTQIGAKKSLQQQDVCLES